MKRFLSVIRLIGAGAGSNVYSIQGGVHLFGSDLNITFGKKSDPPKMIPYTRSRFIAHRLTLMPEGYDLNDPRSTERFVFIQVLSDRTDRMNLMHKADLLKELIFCGNLSLAVSFPQVESLFKHAIDNTPDSPNIYKVGGFYFFQSHHASGRGFEWD